MTAYPVKDLIHFCNINVKKSIEIGEQIISYYDLTFVLKGKLVYHINGERYEVCKNDAILLSPGTLRSREELCEDVSYASFNFKVYDGICLPDSPFLSSVVTDEIRVLLSAFSQSHLSSLYHSEEKLKNMLNYILFEIIDTVELKSNDKNTVKMIKYIDEHISEHITLSMISENVHLSREYTSYLFKKELGKTVIEYINERKMLIAKNMIQAGNMSLCDIAESLGYENYGYFSRSFKKHFNTSPKQYRSISNG